MNTSIMHLSSFSVLIILAFSSVSFGQVFNDFKELDPVIRIAFQKIPDAKVSGIGGTFGTTAVSAGFAVPVAGDMVFVPGNYSGYRLLLNASGSQSFSELSALNRSEVFYDLRSGLTGLFLPKSKNLYRLSAMLGISEDKDAMKNSQLRFTMAGNGTYHTSNDFSIVYGLAVTYLYGDGRLLPMLGFRWQFAEQWTAGFVLPFSVGVMYRPEKNTQVRISLSPAGDKMRFENGNAFSGAGEIIAMRITQAKLSAETKMRISESITLFAELGFFAARNISFLDGNLVLQSGKVDPKGFISAGLNFRLDESFFTEDFL